MATQSLKPLAEYESEIGALNLRGSGSSKRRLPNSAMGRSRPVSPTFGSGI